MEGTALSLQFFFLEMGKVSEELTKAVTENTKLCEAKPKEFNFSTIMSLTENDLTAIEANLPVRYRSPEKLAENVTQIQSRTMMFRVKSANKIFKYCSDKTVAFYTISMLGKKPKQVLLPDDHGRIFNIPFCVFRVLLPPLHSAQALPCLGYLLDSVATAIEELHQLEFAHMDIRLDNICFTHENGKVVAVLIDLDHCNEVDSFEGASCAEVMYNFGVHQVESSCFDWRQLGLIAVWIHCEKYDTEEHYHFMEVPEEMKRDKFINNALRGIFNRELLHSSPVYLDHQKSTLESVLRR